MGTIRAPYRDTPVPRVFGNVSPLDPQLFSTINDFARRVTDKEKRAASTRPSRSRSGWKTMPPKRPRIWSRRKSSVLGRHCPEYRRMAIDVAIQAGLGQVLRREVPQRRAVPDLRKDRRIGKRFRSRSRSIVKREPPGRRSSVFPNRSTSPTSPSARIRNCAGTGPTACRRSTLI